MIFESVINWNSSHPNIDTRFQRIALRIETQDRRMFCDSVPKQDNVNVVVKILSLRTRWFLLHQLAGGMCFIGIRKVSASLCCDRAAAISLLQFEGNCCKWRQVNDDRVFAAHPFAGFALNAAEIS